MNTDASTVVYKFRSERTGFNMYTEYTQPQLTFLALHPWTEKLYDYTYSILKAIHGLFQKIGIMFSSFVLWKETIAIAFA